MRDLRIVFMGTPEFAVSSLEAILNSAYEVVGVITAPDRPAGRGRKLRESAVKEFAKSKNIPVLQPTNLKSKDFQKELEALKPNVQVVVAFRMLPKSVWNLPEYGTFNLHASLLPQYRGAAPINWAIMNGEKKTGVSTFFLDEKIDTGAMILQKSTKIAEDEHLESLHDRLMLIGAKLVVETLNNIAKNSVTPVPQPESSELNDAPKLTRDNTKIDWDKPLDEIFDHIRGLNPYPAAWSLLDNASDEMNVKIYGVDKIKEKHDLEYGNIQIIEKKMKVAVNGGFIQINEIQLPGKRKMEVTALLNGFNFAPDAKMR